MVGQVTTKLREKGFKNVRSFDDVKQRFIEFARLIMCSHKLVYGEDERSWKITALELYLCTCSVSNIWRDPYTHANPAQLESGTWYVHDDGHRAPIYSGIDITCGSAGIYGGLLIRELCLEERWVFQRIVRGKNINKERLDNVWTEDELKTIQTEIHKQSIDSSRLRLAPTTPMNDLLYIGPRIGLKKRPDSRDLNPEGISFRNASLRIATSKTATLKTLMNPLPLE